MKENPANCTLLILNKKLFSSELYYSSSIAISICRHISFTESGVVRYMSLNIDFKVLIGFQPEAAHIILYIKNTSDNDISSLSPIGWKTLSKMTLTLSDVRRSSQPGELTETDTLFQFRIEFGLQFL